MLILEVLALALGLTMDVLSVSIAVGLSLPDSSLRQRLRLTFHFALFHFLMPALGWLAGISIQQQIRSFDHWIAFVLLSALGIKMIKDWRSEEDVFSNDPTRGMTMVTLCIATSIDALAVGVSIALLHVDVWQVGILVGLSAALMTTIGLNFGRSIGQKMQSWARLFGGLAIIAVGVKILIDHSHIAGMV